MRLRVEADPGELGTKGRALVREVAGVLHKADGELADALDKAAMPADTVESRYPVLRDLDLGAMYRAQMRRMLRDIGDVLDRAARGLAKGGDPGDGGP